MQPVDSFLERCVKADGSDLHFKTDTGKVYIRVHGELVDLDAPIFSDDEFRSELYKILKPYQCERFERDLELDFAFEIPGLSRFRGNAYQQRGHMQAGGLR
jgi:twitching motility protein PilT